MRILLIFSLIALCYASSFEHTRVPELRDNFAYDFYILAIEWPGAATMKFPANVTTWTMHGADGSWPSNCDPSDYLSKSQIQPIENLLNKYWISYKQDSFSFWSHEWSTHGTCAKAHSGITNQISFFNAAMNALHLVDVDHAFSNAGLVPSMTAKYTISQFAAAAKSQLGVPIAFRCESKQLADLFICMDMDIKPMACPQSVYDSYITRQGCSDSEQIMYKTIPYK